MSGNKFDQGAAEAMPNTEFSSGIYEAPQNSNGNEKFDQGASEAMPNTEFSSGVYEAPQNSKGSKGSTTKSNYGETPGAQTDVKTDQGVADKIKDTMG
ncbi:hypothetical protein NPX13_g1512 [Xylaria arbuscula]|uniref:Uncharacterized protein n=1 Tax=Xylaria arbuscula TaxID=114810 RepID=A0A9W8NLW8_9PEZI|nr:hypothetical protein NPX13_g1512 [Xylaria arbuscula]